MLALSIGVNIERHRDIPPTTHMDNIEQKFVVCGYAAAHTQYVVSTEKAYDLQLDTENGEQILTHPMSLEEAQDYIGL